MVRRNRMTEDPGQSLKAGPEQLLYASILEKGMYVGLLILLITYAIYVLGIVSPYLPHSEVPRYWSFPVSEYLHQTKIHAGWAWVGMLKYGDFLNFVGIAILAAVSIMCFLAIVPTLLRNNDTVYAVLAIVEAIILIVAASGILGAGGH
jgi:hypothetical protein